MDFHAMPNLFHLENRTSFNSELIYPCGRTQLRGASKIDVSSSSAAARCFMDLSINNDQIIIHGNWQPEREGVLSVIELDRLSNSRVFATEYLLKNLGPDLKIFEEPYGTETLLRSGSTLKVSGDACETRTPNTIVIHQEGNWSGIAIWEEGIDLKYKLNGTACAFSV